MPSKADKAKDAGLTPPQFLRDLRKAYIGGRVGGNPGSKKPERILNLEKMKADDFAGFLRLLNETENEWTKQKEKLLDRKEDEEEAGDKDECLALVEKLIDDYMKEHPEAK